MDHPSVHWIVPGSLQTRTGGYVYDRQVVTELGAMGWSVTTHVVPHALPGTAGEGDARLKAVLAALPDGATVVVDGLAAGDHPGPLERHQQRLRQIVLVHHPLALETGLTPREKSRLIEHERRTLAATRQVVCTSEDTAERLRKDYAVPEARLGVVRPAVARRPTKNLVERPRQSPWNLLCVATLTPRKDHRTLFAALSPLRHHPWVLRCVGDANLDSDTSAMLRAYVQREGLDGRVTLMGSIEDAALEACWSAADLFVSASLYEGYGMAIEEALAHGVPVIATRSGEAASRVPAGAGRLVDPGDRVALQRCLENFFGDPVQREGLWSCAAQASAGMRSWSDAGREFADVLMRVGQEGG